MKVKIEDMRDWLRDYYSDNSIDRSDDGDGESQELLDLEEYSDAEVAEDYVLLRFYKPMKKTNERKGENDIVMAIEVILLESNLDAEDRAAIFTLIKGLIEIKLQEKDEQIEGLLVDWVARDQLNDILKSITSHKKGEEK